MMRRLLLACAVLLVAAPAFAANSWTECGGSSGLFGSPTTPAIAPGACFEYQWTSGTGALTVNVTAAYALLLFDPDIAAATVPGSPAEIMVQKCARNAAATANNCVDMLDANLIGTPGAPGTQATAIRIKRGIYRIVLDTAPTAVTALIQVEGEN